MRRVYALFLSIVKYQGVDRDPRRALAPRLMSSPLGDRRGALAVCGAAQLWVRPSARMKRFACDRVEAPAPRRYFIAHTVENVLQDVEGKQLLCEAFFLYGTMLLLLEARAMVAS